MARTRVGDLGRYRARRDFKKTAEPRGARSRTAGRSFVIQKHAARRLHYDFRLELDGVLKSWAVTRGPSLDPADRRLAVHTEDHPLEYGGFEGVIPSGEYGGGTVMIWDRGTWEPDGDSIEGYRKGRLRFRLNGHKLQGGWTLVRMGGRAGEANNWLLIKRRDDAARPGAGDALLETETRSVASGREMAKIGAEADRVWTSRPAKRQRPPRAATQSAIADVPDFIPPQLPTLVEAAPDGPEWLHEIKLDGYRVLCRIANRRVQFLTRTGQDWTRKFLSLAKAVPGSAESALIDGEIVVLNEQGTSSFQALQEALTEGDDARLAFYAFDLLYRDGEDLRELPLEQRKARLAAMLPKAGGKPQRFRLSEHIDGRGPEVFSTACDMALEGLVSKHRDAPYSSGRGTKWVKTKCSARQEFAIGGYTDLKDAKRSIGALLVGYFEDERFRYAGKVGTGFTTESRRALFARLQPLRRTACPFDAMPPVIARTARWVEPRLVAEIAYGEWTRDGRLRHPSFQALRSDKPAQAVTRDRATSLASAASPGGQAANGARRRPRAGTTVVAGVELTHPDKVLYAEQGITKRDLAEYYVAIAECMLPHVVGRPLTLVRCPDGAARKCFYQKHPGAGVPPSLSRVRVREKTGTGEQLAVESIEGLIALVQMGVLEFHVSGARATDLERPDRLVFDVDPDPSVAWPQVVATALELRDRLKQLRLESFVKTTGGKGLHVVVPIVPVRDWDEVKAFTKAVAVAMEQDAPERYTANIRKAARKGRIFIDFLRNDRHATAIAPFSTRARSGATVATPLRWDELSAKLSPQALTIATVQRRVRAMRKDPWAETGALRQTIPPLSAAIKRRIAA